MSNTSNTCLVRIWDLPTRVFHGLLILTFGFAWLTEGDSRYLDMHVFAGYAFFALLGFRVLWGFVGSHYAKFRQFACGWSSVWQYTITLLTSKRQHFIGHNPAGSWAIFLILGLGFVVSITGLLTLGGEERHGPLAGLISFHWGTFYHQWHEISAWALLALVFVHITGVFAESVLHRENLVKAMISGFKPVAQSTLNDVPNYRFIAALIVLTFVGSATWYFKGYITQTEEKPYIPFTGPHLVQNDLWQTACGDCHLAYHPSLLPARSWQKMLAEQENHFEEDLYLDEEMVTALNAYAVANAAETAPTEAGWQINQSIPANQVPLRITQTHYWKEQHEKIPEAIWKHPKVNFPGQCETCHLDAFEGTFEDAAMHYPK